MARSYAIGLYKLSVREARKADSQVDLGQDLDGKNGNFYQYFETQLGNYKSDLFEDTDTDHYLRLEKIEVSDTEPIKGKFYKKIEGRLESGDSGFASVLVHTKKRTSRDKSKDEAEMLPYYFCLSETNDPKSAALCLQRFGKVGVLTTFTKFLKAKFKEDFPSLVLQIDPFLPDFYIKKFINKKQVQEFKYTYLAPVGDAVTLLLNKGVRDRKEASVIIETRIKAQRGDQLQIVETAAKNVGELLSKMTPKLGINQSSIVDKTITFVNAEGQKRTFSLSRPDNSALPYIDVTEEVQRDLKGHPDYEQMKRATEDILKESKLY